MSPGVPQQELLPGHRHLELRVRSHQLRLVPTYPLQKPPSRGLEGSGGEGCFSFGGTVQYIEESNSYLCFVVYRLKRGLVT